MIARIARLSSTERMRGMVNLPGVPRARASSPRTGAPRAATAPPAARGTAPPPPAPAAARAARRSPASAAAAPPKKGPGGQRPPGPGCSQRGGALRELEEPVVRGAAVEVVVDGVDRVVDVREGGARRSAAGGRRGAAERALGRRQQLGDGL